MRTPGAAWRRLVLVDDHQPGYPLYRRPVEADRDPFPSDGIISTCTIRKKISIIKDYTIYYLILLY